VPTLWNEVSVGRITLPHRLAMAPMTRNRALPDGSPTPLMAEYYTQRASMGLLITEGTQPSDDGQGYLLTPGIYRPEHVAAWRLVTDAVHTAGAHMFLQLMHVGRNAHPDNTPHHRQALAPSAITPGTDIFTATGMQLSPPPREMTHNDIATTISDFRHAAKSAIEAGADGIELHGANGYLLHQFLSPNANQRSDQYGGSTENRSRFVIEVAAAVADEIGSDRVGIRLSPGQATGGIDEGNGVTEQYHHLVAALEPLDLAYLHLVQIGDEELLHDIRHTWNSTLLVHRPGRDLATLSSDLETGTADIVPVGRWALANPDLVERLRHNAPLNDADPSTFYGGGRAGYTDYPTLSGYPQS
jgi:N-ethylmaleimide reductase